MFREVHHATLTAVKSEDTVCRFHLVSKVCLYFFIFAKQLLIYQSRSLKKKFTTKIDICFIGNSLSLNLLADTIELWMSE